MVKSFINSYRERTKLILKQKTRFIKKRTAFFRSVKVLRKKDQILRLKLNHVEISQFYKNCNSPTFDLISDM